MDPDLAWTHHVRSVKEKGMKSVQAIQSLAGSTWGFSGEQMLSIYNTVVVPQMTYECSVWYPTEPKGVQGIQRKTLAAVTRYSEKRFELLQGHSELLREGC